MSALETKLDDIPLDVLSTNIFARLNIRDLFGNLSRTCKAYHDVALRMLLARQKFTRDDVARQIMNICESHGYLNVTIVEATFGHKVNPKRGVIELGSMTTMLSGFSCVAVRHQANLV